MKSGAAARTRQRVFEKTGINFCLTADGASDTVWLPSDIGIAMRYGLSFETALESVTIRPARLLGLEDHVGSLEAGQRRGRRDLRRHAV